MTANVKLGDWVLLSNGEVGQVGSVDFDDEAHTYDVWSEGRIWRVQPYAILDHTPVPFPSTTHKARLLTARTTHPCEGWDDKVMRHLIEPGDEYVFSKVYPGHPSGKAGQRGEDGAAPAAMKLCLSCAAHFTDTAPEALREAS